MLRLLPLLLACATPSAAQPPELLLSTVPARGAGRVGLRLVGVEFGSGSETDIDLLDPFIPKGFDRLFDWDIRLQMREDALGFRAQYRRPEVVEKLSFGWRRLVDVPVLAGMGGIRDDLYEGVGGSSPPDKRGFAVGASAALSKRWGVNAKYSETLTQRPGEFRLDQKTSAGVGWSPLGANNGERWNWALLAAVDYSELDVQDAAVDEYKEGFGLTAGPNYQYALGWAEFPLARRFGLEDKLKLDRFEAGLMFSDSEIRDFSATQTADVTAYATKYLKFLLGLGLSYVPDAGDWVLSARTGLSLRFSWADFAF